MLLTPETDTRWIGLPRGLGGALALHAFLLHCQPDGLKEIVFVIEDVILGELHQLVEGGLCIRQLLGGIGRFFAIDVQLAQFHLLGTSLYTLGQENLL